MNYQQYLIRKEEISKKIQQKVYNRILENTKTDLKWIDSSIKFQLEWLKEEEERNGKETYEYGFGKGELEQFYKMKDYYQDLIYSLESPNRFMKEEVK